MEPENPKKTLLIGFLALALLAGLLWGAWGVYTQQFTKKFPVTLETDKAGLLLAKGADVRLSGVNIGQVSAVNKLPVGAQIELNLEPELAKKLPGSVVANVGATSAFGPKVVNILLPKQPTGPGLSPGQTIRAVGNNAEINDLLLSLSKTMQAISVDQLREVLWQTANALEGRGTKLGTFIRDFNRYLVDLKPSLPRLKTNLKLSSQVFTQFADAMPDIVSTLRSSTKISSTFVSTQALLHTVMLDYTMTSRQMGKTFKMLKFPLLKVNQVLRPTATLLKEYSPGLRCLVEGLNAGRIGAEKASGKEVAALQMRVVILPGQQSYKYPRDLPKIVNGLGPDCYQYPVTPDEMPSPRYRFDDGTHVYDGRTDAMRLGGPQLYAGLFGENLSDLIKKFLGGGQP